MLKNKNFWSGHQYGLRSDRDIDARRRYTVTRDTGEVDLRIDLQGPRHYSEVTSIWPRQNGTLLRDGALIKGTAGS